MKEKQEKLHEQRPDGEHPSSFEVTEVSSDSPVPSDASTHKPEHETGPLRPRNVSGKKRVVQREEARRVFVTNRGIGRSGSQHTFTSTSETVTSHAGMDIRHAEFAAGTLEERETVKWAAWGALLISLITSFLLAMYSSRDFSPAFEYHDLELSQKRLSTDVAALKYNTHLERIEHAILHAQFEIVMRKDYETAELVLDNAKADLQRFIDSLPIEDTVEPKQVLSKIERVLRDVRRGPSLLEERLKKISDDLMKINASNKS